MPRGAKRRVVRSDDNLPEPVSEEQSATAEPTIALTPIDRGALWGRLRLNASQLAALCGVTLRQVMYWSDRGYLPHLPGDARTFTGAGLDTALLLAQAQAAGLRYGRAAELARQYLANEFTRGSQPVPTGPTRLGTGLRVIEESARELREQMIPASDEAETTA